MQLKRSSHNDIVFEWIPYNQLGDIKEISKGDFATIHSAIWKNGPLHCSIIINYNWRINKNSIRFEYARKSDKKVVLKCLYNSQNITNEFLDEV